MLKTRRMLSFAIVLAVQANIIIPSISSSTSSSSSQGEQNDDGQTIITTTCSQDTGQEVVQLPPVNNMVLVNLTLPERPAGTSMDVICKWEIPPPNSTSSTQIFLLPSVAMVNFPALACGMGAFDLSEKKVTSSSSPTSTSSSSSSSTSSRKSAAKSSSPPHLLSLPPCLESNPTAYARAVMTRPGFSLLVTVRFNNSATTPTTTNSAEAAAAGTVTLFLLQPISWAGIWPSGMFITTSSTETAFRRFNARQALQISRMPDFFVCRWQFQSPGGEVVHLQVKSYDIQLDTKNPSVPSCSRTGDRLLVRAYDLSNTTTTSENNNSPSSSSGATIPVCRNPDIMKYEITSAGGRVSVTFETDGTGGAYEHFYFDYWHEDGCPSSQNKAYLKASQDQEKFFKGVSSYNNGSGSMDRPVEEGTKTCTWVIYRTDENHVVMLTRMDASQFQTDCDDNKVYLQLGSDHHPAGRLSLCNKNDHTSSSSSKKKIPKVFPVWIDRKQLVVHFNDNSSNSSSSNNNDSDELNMELPMWSEERHLQVNFVQGATESPSSSSPALSASLSSSAAQLPRSFVLHYRAVRRSQCQGLPARRIVGFDPAVVEERLQPVPTAEHDINGPVCLWLFTAKNLGHILQLTLTIPAAVDADNPLGIFAVYNINATTATITTTSITQADKINPDNSTTTSDSSTSSSSSREENRKDNSMSVTYTSDFRAMLVAYRRGYNPDLQEVDEEGFVMAVRQIRKPPTSGGTGLQLGSSNGYLWVLVWWCVMGGWFVLK